MLVDDFQPGFFYSSLRFQLPILSAKCFPGFGSDSLFWHAESPALSLFARSQPLQVIPPRIYRGWRRTQSFLLFPFCRSAFTTLMPTWGGIQETLDVADSGDIHVVHSRKLYVARRRPR